MLKPPPIGDQELLLLQYVTDRAAPVTVREVTQEWGEQRTPPLARTTILTMMERLRKKGLLEREKGADGSTFQYRPSVEKAVLMQGLVRDFVAKTLGGSVSPFVAYLADAKELSRTEIAELRRLVDTLEEDAPGDASERR